MNNRQREESVTLEILEAIDARSDVTQRHLARRAGIALGLTNSYLKRCVRKGLIKIQQAPANRYLYYLTPKGFAEKSRLTARYLSSSLEFYRKAAESCSQAFELCERRNWHDILLCGASELAEIACQRAIEHDIRIIGIYDKNSDREMLLNRNVYRSLNQCGPFDACLLTDLTDPSATADELMGELDTDTIIVPYILGFRIQTSQ